MKLLFVCGSLEPGRDGVGDYTRRLAGACTALGAECALLALHDPHAAHLEEWETAGVRTLRLPAAEAWPERLRCAGKFLKRVAPDCLSLQLVPYGFGNRGMVWELGSRLKILGAGRPWHIMFHELWIGADLGARWRERLHGAMQRRSVQRLLGELTPRAITTTNDAYARLLGRRGIAVSVLPLFGNIPVTPAAAKDDERWLEAELRHYREGWLFAFFGTLHPQWQPEPLFTYLRQAAATAGKRPVLVSIGRMGPGELLWDKLEHTYRADFDFVPLGEQSEGRIAALLRRADFGVAASPWALIGKSGTAQSMAEHGLPVLVSRDDVRYPGQSAPPEPEGAFIKVQADLPERLPQLRRRPAVSALEAVAARFLTQLEKN